MFHNKTLLTAKDRMMRIDRFWYGVIFVCSVITVLLAFISCANEWGVGQSQQELMAEMMRVDSLIQNIRLQVGDSTVLDFEGFYIDAQRINNGHE